MTKKKILSIAFITAFSLVTGFLFTLNKNTASASPSLLSSPISCSTNQRNASNASSTLAYLVPGLATSTLDCNISIATNGLAQTFDSAQLFIQNTASTSASVLAYWIEDSQDGVDYFPRVTTTNLNATTTILTGTPQIFQVPFATSTATDYGNRKAGVGRYSIPVTFVSKYMRVIFFLQQGSTNAGVYAEIIGKYQSVY